MFTTISAIYIQLLPHPQSNSAIYDEEQALGDLWSKKSHSDSVNFFLILTLYEVMNLRYSLICGSVVYRVVFGFWFLMCAL